MSAKAPPCAALPKGPAPASRHDGATRMERARPRRQHAAPGASFERPSELEGGLDALEEAFVPVTDPERAAYEYVRRHGGETLDTLDRAFFERRLNRSLPDVRLHRGGEAQALSSRLGALAWSVGRHVVFGRAVPSPVSEEGREVLAHELVHVLQHEATGSTSALRSGTEPEGGGAERQAREVSDAISSAEPFRFVPAARAASIALLHEHEATRGPRVRQRRPVDHALERPVLTQSAPEAFAGHPGDLLHALHVSLDLERERWAVNEERYTGGGRAMVVRGEEFTISLRTCVFRVTARSDGARSPVFERVGSDSDPYSPRLPPALRAAVEAAVALARLRVPVAEANNLLRRGWGRGGRSLHDTFVGDAIKDVATTLREYELRVAHIGDGSGATFAFTEGTTVRVVTGVLREIFRHGRSAAQAARLASLFASALSNTRNHRIARMLSDGTLDPSALLLLGAAGHEQSVEQAVRVLLGHRTELRHAVQAASREGLARALPAATLVDRHLRSIKRRVDQSRLRAVVMGQEDLAADLQRLDRIVRGVTSAAHDFAEARDLIVHDFGEAVRPSQTPATMNVGDESRRDSHGAFVAMARTLAEIFDALAPCVRLATSRQDALRRARVWADGGHAQRQVAVYDLSLDARADTRGHVLVRVAPSPQAAAEVDRPTAGALVAVLGGDVLHTRAGDVVGDQEPPWVRAMGLPAGNTLSDDERAQLHRRFAEVMARDAAAHLDRMLDSYRRLRAAHGWAVQLLLCHAEGGSAAVARRAWEVSGLPEDAAAALGQAVDDLVGGSQQGAPVASPRAPADPHPVRLFEGEEPWVRPPQEARLWQVARALGESEAFQTFDNALVATVARLERLHVDISLRLHGSTFEQATWFTLEGESRFRVLRTPDAALVARLWGMFPGIRAEYLNDLSLGLDPESTLDTAAATTALQRTFVEATHVASQSTAETAEHVLDAWVSRRMPTLEESRASTPDEIARGFEAATATLVPLAQGLPEVADDQVAPAVLRVQAELVARISDLERLRVLVFTETNGRFGPTTQEAGEILRRVTSGGIDFRFALAALEPLNGEVMTLAGGLNGQGVVAVVRSFAALIDLVRSVAPTLRFANVSDGLNEARRASASLHGVIGVYRLGAPQLGSADHALVWFTVTEWERQQRGAGGSLAAIARRGGIFDSANTEEEPQHALREELVRALERPAGSGTGTEEERERLYGIFARLMNNAAQRAAQQACRELRRMGGHNLAPTLVAAYRRGGRNAVTTLVRMRSDLGDLYASGTLPDGVARAAERLERPAEDSLMARLHADDPLDELRRFPSYVRLQESIANAQDDLDAYAASPTSESAPRAQMADLWDHWTLVRPAFLREMHLELPAGDAIEHAAAKNFAEAVFLQGLIDERTSTESEEGPFSWAGRGRWRCVE